MAEMTGVPEPTLRAWERRYKIPTPRRTTSGYRLYGERELEQVRRMRALCDGGLAAADAARAIAKETKKTSKRDDGEPFGQSVRALLRAVDAFDELALEREVRRLAFLGPALAVIDQVIVPTLHAVGDRWMAQELSVAQEHLISTKLGNVLRDFVRLAPGGTVPVLVACFADEHHDLGALATAARLATWGFHPIFLGARTPAEAVARAVASLRPRAVALSVTTTPERERARELVEAYGAACGRTPWAVGGRGVDSIEDHVRAARGFVAGDNADFEKWIRRVAKRKRRAA